MAAASTANEKSAPLRWGILGTGKIAEDFANAVSLCSEVKLHAIGSRSAASAAAFAALFPSHISPEHTHGSIEALLADATVDVIYVATPDALHAPHALMALRAGKHVMVEKPFADSPAAADAIVKEARDRGLFVMEALWTRFVPSVQRALALVSSGALGPVHLVQSDFACAYPIPAGALNALGVYSLALGQMVYEADARRAIKERAAGDAATAASSEATPVVAAELAAPIVPVARSVRALGSLRPDSLSDSQVGVTVQYAPDQLNVFSASLLCNGANDATITGARGRIRLHGNPLWHATDRLTVTRVGDDGSESSVEESFTDAEQPLSAFPRPFHLACSQRLVHEALELTRCVRAGKRETSLWSLAHTQQVMALMEQVRQQIRAPEVDEASKH